MDSLRVLGSGLLTLGTLSCGGDAFDPAALDLEGTWVFNASIEQGSQTCNVSEAPITFTAMSPDSLLGQAREGGTIQCSSGARASAASPFLKNTTVFLIRNGSSVRLDRHGSLLFEGQIRSDIRMSGTITTDSLPGSWIAERQ
jgi:hypothetical protein